MTDTERRGDWIMTFTGIHFWPLDSRHEEIDIRDIAHALALSCRWTGHVRKFYSVAEHSYLASILVPKEHALQALLHDASEAYLSDIARPVKPFLSNYYPVEANLQTMIYQRFGCSVEMDAEVKRVDDALLGTEADQLMASPSEIHHPVQSAACALPCWEPHFAEQMFLNRFHTLTEGQWLA